MTQEIRATQVQTFSDISELEQARIICEDLFEPKAKIFWTDLLLSACIGWIGFILACLSPMSWQMGAAIIVSAVGFYRVSVFIHELAHFKSGTIPGFLAIWNLILGIPLLFPSFIYVGIHANHHRPSTYGTINDPEYMPFAGARIGIIGTTVSVLLFPAFLVVRFVILSPLGLLCPPFHRILERHASSFALNLAYRRQVAKAERIQMIILELLMLATWSCLIALAWQEILPWKFFGVWYGIMAAIMLTNVVRVLGAHHYVPPSVSASLIEQLKDSTNIPGAPWTALWAPVGLRWHALHHLLPNIPYHNMAIAHKRLTKKLSTNSDYHCATSPSLWHSLQTLWCYSPKNK